MKSSPPKPAVTLDSPGLIVLGMHRSGTSCLSGMLQLAGFEAGTVQLWNEDNSHGNRENLLVNKLNDSVLQKNQTSWERAVLPEALQFDDILRIERNRILEDFASCGRPWMFKDPRTLLTLPFWREAIPNPRRIGIFRHPRRVALSLYFRNKKPPLGGLALWVAYNNALLAEHQRAPFPLVCFDLPQEYFVASVIEAIRAECNDLIETGVVDSNAVHRFYSSELIHHRGEEPLEEAALDAAGQSVISDALVLYERLCVLARIDSRPASAATDVATHAFAQLRRADSAAEKGDIDQALLLYRAALSTSPDARCLWKRILSLLLRNEGSGNLLQACDGALSVCPHDMEFLLISAAANRKSGGADKAAALIDEIIELYPHSAEAWMRKGEWLCDDGKWGDGIVALRRSIGNNLPGHFWAHARLGDALVRRGFREDGEISFKDSLELAPDGARAAIYHRFSNALQANGDSLAALGHQELASTLSTEAYIHIGYANLLRRVGKAADATMHIQKALERGIDSPALRNLMDQIHALNH